MPQFKSTYNILKKPDEDEVFNINWMDSDKIILPPTKEWDYAREMSIEDVDIWEVIYEAGGGVGVYASWCPYAEFYLVTTGGDFRNMWEGTLQGARVHYMDKLFETYYGNGASKKAYDKAKELGVTLPVNKVWVNDAEMWLHTKQEKLDAKTLII
jgi:hypothetical protein